MENNEIEQNQESQNLTPTPLESSQAVDQNEEVSSEPVQAKNSLKERDKNQSKELQRKFVINFKKGQDEQAKIISEKIADISNSPIGLIPFEDIVLYLFEEKLQESDYDNIRSNAFERKMANARIKYNKDNKTSYTMQEFLAEVMSNYLQ